MEQENRKRRKKKRFLLLLLLLLILFFVLFYVDIPYSVEETSMVPVNQTAMKNVTTASGEEVCAQLNFTYIYEWDVLDRDPVLGTLTPQLWVTNTMDRTGIFALRFMFINEDAFPFSAYQDAVETATPSFSSRQEYLTLSPGQRILVAIPTNVPDVSHPYWVYADVTPPSFRYCEMTQREVTEDAPQVTTVLVQKTVRVEKSAPVISYIWDWLIALLA